MSLAGAIDTTTMTPVPWKYLLLYSPKTDYQIHVFFVEMRLGNGTTESGESLPLL